MANGTAPARVFQCPNCKEYINTHMTECRFCHAPVNAQAALAAAAQLDKANDVAENGTTRSQGVRNMVIGGLWCVGGILVTAITYGAASSGSGGGRYVIAWGAIVFGAIQFFKGVFQFIAG